MWWYNKNDHSDAISQKGLKFIRFRTQEKPCLRNDTPFMMFSESRGICRMLYQYACREYGLTFFSFRFLPDELAKAFRDATKPQVKFGLYYSLYEWFNPHYLKDKANGFKTDEYVKVSGSRSVKIHTKPRRFFQGFHSVYPYSNSAPILLCHAWQTYAVIWKGDRDFAGWVRVSK